VWAPCGWRCSGITLDMVSMGANEKMEDALQDAAAGRGTLSVSWRRRIKAPCGWSDRRCN
jgi:hypothetical protein